MLAALTALAGVPAGSIAQDAPPAAPAPEQAAAPSLPSLIADLGSPDARTRIAASERLRDGRFGLRELEPILTAGKLSPEQRLRLLTAARQRFDSESRGAMGIQFGDLPDTRGAIIAAPKQGFNAFEVLKPRDRITKADGIVIERRETLQRIIVAHDPGDEVPLTVERDGASIEVKVRLGDFALLNMPRNAEIFAEAWRHRSRGYAAAGPAPAPIESGLLPAAWEGAVDLEEDAELAGQLPSQRARALSIDRTIVVAGGESRLGLGAEPAQRRVDATIFRGPMVAPGGAVFQLNGNIQDLVARRQKLQLSVNRARLALQRVGNGPGSGRTREVERRNLLSQIDQDQMQLSLIENEIQRRAGGAGRAPVPAPGANQPAPVPR